MTIGAKTPTKTFLIMTLIVLFIVLNNVSYLAVLITHGF